MDLYLKGRPCLVTGASQGIGKGAARILAAEGCRLAILARREALLNEFADEIEATGADRPIVIAADATLPDAAEKIRERVYDAFGSLDILVNAAGGSRPVPWDADDDAWQEGMNLNFDTLRRLTNAFMPGMRAQKYGRVINVTGGHEPFNVNVAGTAKAAVHFWAKGLARVVAPDGVTVNSLPPGRINSEQILTKLHADPDERAKFIEQNVPIGYFGEPEDMGNLIAFLASPLARYVTGEVINVDGGMRRYAF